MRHRSLDELAAGNRIVEHVRKDLARIERYYDPALSGPADVDESGVAGPGCSDPVSLTAIDARAEAIRDLRFWCGFILDEVNSGTITTTVRPVIADMAVFIARWTPALCEQHPADAENLEHDARSSADRLEALAKGWRTKRVEIGRCPEQRLLADEHGREWFEPCTGTLWSLIRAADTMLPKVIVCDRESEHQWQPWQWAALGRRLGQRIA